MHLRKQQKLINEDKRSHPVAGQLDLFGMVGKPLPTSLAAGQPPKVVSEILGHSTVAFTMDVYTEVAEELGEAAAEALAAYVPRAPRNPADKTR
jgi:hypothetical protein